MIHLTDITPDNWRSGLKVAPEQERYVANSAVMLARAYAYREWRSRAFVICDDETPVGMGLYYDLPDMERYDFSQLFIDAPVIIGLKQNPTQMGAALVLFSLFTGIFENFR